MKITICQLNPTVGDIKGNLAKISGSLSKIGNETDLVVFPELFIAGYPPRDLLEKEAFIGQAQEAIGAVLNISREHPGVGILFGLPVLNGEKQNEKLYNSAVLISDQRVFGVSHKSLLPTYDVFDETRYFSPAPLVKVIPFKGEKLGVSVCEDMWNDPDLWPRKTYAFDPVEKLVRDGATILINLSASPFYAGKEEIRFSLIQSHALKHGLPFLFVNQVGANDELIFDGRSVCVNREGKLIALFPAFKEHIETVDTNSSAREDKYVPLDKTESVHDALVLGIHDYMKKCGFSKAVVGLSGGIDSTVVACLAKEAIGEQNVLGVSMPSRYTSRESKKYARALAKNLGIQFKTIPISRVYNAYLKTLEKGLAIERDQDVGVHLQNIQARIRGTILMAFSNRFGHLLLSTGNKSEVAVGYCTLYGDMAGGLAVISDVPKTMVYELAGYINRSSNLIPRRIIERAPTAELKFGQLDQDTLPPYDALDKILYYLLEEGYSAGKISEMGFEKEMVKWVINAVHKTEYKRWQAPPGLKITTKAFGMGRRMPIAARYDF